ncbi:MAG: STAS domain-containing protein [Methylomonas sp.]|jgi:anti-anti-sigma factor
MQTLTIENELTIFTAAARKPELIGFLDNGDELEINLSRIEEMDTAGLQLLILCKQEAARLGKNLNFVMHSKTVRDILELTNLADSFGDQLILAGEGR